MKEIDYLTATWNAHIEAANKAFDTIEWNRIQAPGTQGDFDIYWKAKLKWKDRYNRLFPPNGFMELPPTIELWRRDEKSPVHYYDADPKIMRTIYKAPADCNEARECVWNNWNEVRMLG